MLKSLAFYVSCTKQTLIKGFQFCSVLKKVPFKLNNGNLRDQTSSSYNKDSDDTILQQLMKILQSRDSLHTLREKYYLAPILVNSVFTNKFYKSLNTELLNTLLVQPKELVASYGNFLTQNYPKQCEISRRLVKNKQLQNPHLQYAGARQMNRKIYYHHGPPNSGKTYAGLQHLRAAKTGIYCAPLRLLAWEIQQDLLNQNIQCNLITGQDKVYLDEASHTSCTVEIASRHFVAPDSPGWDIACIDEVQMIGDPERGAAWTDIILGLKTKELHLIGDPRALHLINQLANQCGDEFKAIKYNRRSELHVENKVFTFQDLRPDDCVISFNVSQLLKLRLKINDLTSRTHKTTLFQKISNKQSKLNKDIEERQSQENNCAIVYGRLPPEVKKAQAQSFNLGNSSKRLKYLVATNAIGMGLNFRIKRVIFTTLLRRRGDNTVALIDKHEIAQIAGRAGRNQENGSVTCMEESDLEIVQKAIQETKELYSAAPDSTQNKILHNLVKRAALFPRFQQLIDFQQILQELYTVINLESENVEALQQGSINTIPKGSNRPTLAQTMMEFAQVTQLDELFFIERYDEFCQLADLIEHCGLDIADQFVFCQSPLNLSVQWKRVSEVFVFYAEQYAVGGEIKLPIQKILGNRRNFSFDQNNLLFLEQSYHILELYIWLSTRFPNFTEKKLAVQLKQEICRLIDAILSKLK